MSELHFAHVSAAFDPSAVNDGHELGAPHHQGVHEITRDLATDMANLALAVAAGAGDGLFGGGAAYFGGLFGGSASSVTDWFTGPATIGNGTLNWLGSFSACNVYGAAMSAEIDEDRLLVALSFVQERHAAPQATGEPAQTNSTAEGR